MEMSEAGPDTFSEGYINQHKQLKTMEMSEAGPDTFSGGYINQFQPELTHKSSISNEFKDILPWNISHMIMKTAPVSTRIVISNVMLAHPVNMVESQ